jgi:hypothetical protein
MQNTEFQSSLLKKTSKNYSSSVSSQLWGDDGIENMIEKK